MNVSGKALAAGVARFTLASILPAADAAIISNDDYYATKASS